MYKTEQLLSFDIKVQNESLGWLERLEDLLVWALGVARWQDARPAGGGLRSILSKAETCLNRTRTFAQKLERGFG